MAKMLLSYARVCIFFYDLDILTFTLFLELRGCVNTWKNLLHHLEVVGYCPLLVPVQIGRKGEMIQIYNVKICLHLR